MIDLIADFIISIYNHAVNATWYWLTNMIESLTNIHFIV